MSVLEDQIMIAVLMTKKAQIERKKNKRLEDHVMIKQITEILEAKLGLLPKEDKPQ